MVWTTQILTVLNSTLSLKKWHTLTKNWVKSVINLLLQLHLGMFMVFISQEMWSWLQSFWKILRSTSKINSEQVKTQWILYFMVDQDQLVPKSEKPFLMVRSKWTLILTCNGQCGKELRTSISRMKDTFKLKLATLMGMTYRTRSFMIQGFGWELEKFLLSKDWKVLLKTWTT